MQIDILASGSSGNCYHISNGSTSLLLDCGIGIKTLQKGINFKLSDIAGCLLTHEHIDHAKTATTLIKKGIDIYTSQGTATACNLYSHRLHIVTPLQAFKIDTLHIMPFPITHDAQEPLGFFITCFKTNHKLLYFTDTGYLRYRFAGITHMLAECNHNKNILQDKLKAKEINKPAAKRIIQNHMSIDTLETMLRANDLKDLQQIYLIHISKRHGDPDQFKRRVEQITTAQVHVC